MVFRLLSLCSLKLVSNTVFTTFTFLLILIDCIILIWNLDYPHIEVFISIFYLCEMFLKMISFGLFFDETSYFRNKWNFLDFFIVLNLFCTRILAYYLLIDISSWRNLIVLRLLKIPSFQIMIDHLFYTFEALLETFLIFMLFIMIFAILSLQLFNGLLSFRCCDMTTGLFDINPSPCSSNDSCSQIAVYCVRTISNPDQGITSFDNVFLSFMQTFRIISLDNWTDELIILQNVFSDYIWIYVLVTIIIGNFFLLNIMLAVLKVKFSEQHPNLLIDYYLEKYKEKCFDLKQLKKQGLLKKKEKNTPVDKTTGGFRPFEILKLNNWKNIFSIKKLKIKGLENLYKNFFSSKIFNIKQSIQLKKILDKKKKTLMDSISIKFQAKNFEIRVKANDNFQSNSLIDVIPNMYKRQ